MTGGLWRQGILLPESAASWSRERRAVVLSHELIHVRRRDTLRHLMRRAVLALYWFHPLMWIASRLAMLASEKACDEEVLSLGTRPSEYARHLHVLATGLSRGPTALALPIVHPSQLERRIMSILARRRPRPSLLRTAVTFMVIGGAGVSVAFVRPVPNGEAESLEVPSEASARIAARPTIAAEAATESSRETVTPAALLGVECLSSSNDSIRSFSIRGAGSTVPNWKWTDGGFTIVRPVAACGCVCVRRGITLNAKEPRSGVGEDAGSVVESRGEKPTASRSRGGPADRTRRSVDANRQPFGAEAAIA